MGIFAKLFGKGKSDNADHNIQEIVTTTEQGAYPQEITAVDEQLISMFQSWANSSKVFLNCFSNQLDIDELARYDDAFKAWRDSKKKDPTRDEVISMLGAYLGNRLVCEQNMEWVKINDQYGEVFAVRHKNLEILAFPFDTIIKRVETNDVGFISGTYHAIAKRVSEARANRRN